VRSGRSAAQDTSPAPQGRDERRRIDLCVLLLSADGQEPAFRAWEAALDREGVPYQAIVARRGHPPIDARTLTVDAMRARYQAVIVAAGGLPAFDGARYVSALTADEWAALADFERDFGIRRITGFAYPSALYGLSAPTSAGATDELAGRLTAAGRAVFGELRGDVPVDPNAYGYLAKPADPDFTTLVAGPQNSALVGIYTHPDGRQEMVCTVDGNPAMIHVQLLRHGMLRWVTRGAPGRWMFPTRVPPSKIHVIRNGVEEPPEPTPAPRTASVVAVGRIDPLKDVHTMLRVAAEVISRMPEATFRYYGPVTQGQEAYGRSCDELHARLGLGDRFRFMGPTHDPNGVIRDADMVLMTSISEGLPMALLEAMSQARPVVSTGVGGVPEVVCGCGMVAAPGDTHALALAVLTLLRNPELATELGRRGHGRVQRVFARSASLTGYRDLFERFTATAEAA